MTESLELKDGLCEFQGRRRVFSCWAGRRLEVGIGNNVRPLQILFTVGDLHSSGTEGRSLSQDRPQASSHTEPPRRVIGSLPWVSSINLFLGRPATRLLRISAVGISLLCNALPRTPSCEVGGPIVGCAVDE